MSVLILGATSPIARAVATEYASRGHNVFVAARDEQKAKDIASDLKLRHDIDARGGAFDALDMDNHAALVQHVEDEVGPISVALIAFGAMGDQQESQQDIEKAREVIDINYTGAVSICEAISARMSPRKHGSIIGISSVAGDRGRQSNYIYGSAKGAFTLYLQGLRNRLHEDGVHVMTAKLGFVDTRMTYGLETNIPIASPEDVGKALYKAQQSKTDVLYYPKFWAGIMGIIKTIPESLFKRLKL